MCIRDREYAYDDWALAQFAKQVMHHREEYDALLKRSFSYQNLFNAEELSFLPRYENEFKLHPGNSGYKEGDQFVYSYFVPQNPKDLINLMGGDSIFTARLDAAFTDQDIVFDNETVFHIPYQMCIRDRPFSVMVEHADTLKRPILLSVFIENYSNEGGIDKPVRASYLSDAKQLTGWSCLLYTSRCV